MIVRSEKPDQIGSGPNLVRQRERCCGAWATSFREKAELPAAGCQTRDLYQVGGDRCARLSDRRGALSYRACFVAAAVAVWPSAKAVRCLRRPSETKVSGLAARPPQALLSAEPEPPAALLSSDSRPPPPPLVPGSSQARDGGVEGTASALPSPPPPAADGALCDALGPLVYE